jgi:RNA polymerase sigma-70 factor (ECF subfamily)
VVCNAFPSSSGGIGTTILFMSALGTSAAGQPGVELERAFAFHRRELTGFCYRMLGAAAEAEAAVQETIQRARSALARFAERISMRTWLYKLANGVCRDLLRNLQRRLRPMECGPPARIGRATAGLPRPDATWVQPVADVSVVATDDDPVETAAARESIRLAVIAELQHLPAAQRAVLILCDVLRWPVGEVATLLDTTSAAVDDALKCARSTMAALRSEPLDSIAGPEHERLLASYADAFERFDVPALVRLMHDDVVMTLLPYGFWLRGASDLAAWFNSQGIGCKGSRLVPIGINGSAGFGSYVPVRPGRWEPFAIQVIEVAGSRIVGHHSFLAPQRFSAYGLPLRIEA